MPARTTRTVAFRAPAAAALTLALTVLPALVASCSVSDSWNMWFTEGNTSAFTNDLVSDPSAPASATSDVHPAPTPGTVNAAPDLETLGRLTPRGYRELTATEAAEVLDHYEVVDVREPQELLGSLGQLPGVRNIPLGSLPSRLGEIPDARPLLVVCRSGNRSGQACTWVAERTGRPCAHIGGGMIAMQRHAQAASTRAAVR